jgi:GT2 family glycosyltransferase
MTKKPSVTVVIVSYNSRAVIPDAIASAKASRDAGLVAECLVVDNQSADGTVEFVRRHHPWCTVIENEENLGFGRANNIGIGRARTRYVLLLNPDAALDRAGLDRLVSLLDTRPHAGAAAPAIGQPDGRWQFAGDLLRPHDVVLEAIGHPRAFERRRTIRAGEVPFRTSWVCGAVVLVRKAMLNDVGAFDPRYFLYFEETDLWQRARRAGWELWATGEAVASHSQGGSAKAGGRRLYHGCIPEHFFRSRFQYLRAHFGWPKAAAAELVELGVMATRAAMRAAGSRASDDFWTRLEGPVLGRALRGATGR